MPIVEKIRLFPQLYNKRYFIILSGDTRRMYIGEKPFDLPNQERFSFIELFR